MVKTTNVVKATKTTSATKTPATKTMTTKTTTKTVAKVAPAANLAKVTNQVSFLEKHLRGTGRTISAVQAQANYGIAKLTARISELRAAGLNVKTIVNTSGNTAYKISARDVNGSRAKMFAI